MKLQISSPRWILLAAGIIAIICLTGLNVYSLLELKEISLISNKENKELQVLEFSDRIRNRFFSPFWGIHREEITAFQNQDNLSDQFYEAMREYLVEASEDSIFTDIYYKPEDGVPCSQAPWLMQYNRETQNFERVTNYPDLVCDGMGYASIRMKPLMPEYDNNWNLFFDTNRSMTIALVDLNEQVVIGYLTLPIDQYTLINEYLPSAMKRRFGGSDDGMNVWIRDWTNNEIIASNTEEVFSHDKIDFRQRFPEIFNDWRLEVQLTTSTAITASNSSLVKNLLVLGVAVLFLLGSLVFMFITAQRERALAQRQAGFLANVTHELKTPLAVMQAAGENLSDGRVLDTKRLKAYGEHIYSEAIRLRKMIEKLLDVAKSDAGQALIEQQPVYLNDALSKYVRENRSYIENKGFRLETSIPKKVPPTMIDPGSFETIVGNLIENSLKYSEGDKFLFLSLHQHDKKVIITVRDHGKGIPRSSLHHVFDKFYRVEDAMTARTKGHGLGLSIVKNLTELNGGVVHVESEVGKGSTFSVSFPAMQDIPEEVPGPTEAEYQAPVINQDQPKYVS